MKSVTERAREVGRQRKTEIQKKRQWTSGSEGDEKERKRDDKERKRNRQTDRQTDRHTDRHRESYRDGEGWQNDSTGWEGSREDRVWRKPSILSMWDTIDCQRRHQCLLTK